MKLTAELRDCSHIVRIDDYAVEEKEEEVGGTLFIRMELLTPLGKYLSDKQMQEEDVRRLGIEICQALEACHRAGILHRDVKPENIFVTAEGSFKLGDFGIARQLEHASTYLTRVGTPFYAAPEVSLANKYDGRADIYSLGLVLYRFLNHNRLPFMEGKRLLTPFDRSRAMERRLGGETLPPPEEASRKTAEIILKACAFRKEERFASAREMGLALQAGSPKAEKKFKNKPVYALIAALLLLPLLFFGWREGGFLRPVKEMSSRIQTSEGTAPSETSYRSEIAAGEETPPPAQTLPLVEGPALTEAAALTETNTPEETLSTLKESSESRERRATQKYTTAATPVPVVRVSPYEDLFEFELNPDNRSYQLIRLKTAETVPYLGDWSGKVPLETLQAGSRRVSEDGEILYNTPQLDVPQDILELPAYYHDFPVTAISAHAFSGCYLLADIIIPETIATLDPYAFAYCKLEGTLQIPGTIKQIGEAAFFRSRIHRVELFAPLAHGKINQNAFTDAKIQSLWLEKGTSEYPLHDILKAVVQAAGSDKPVVELQEMPMGGITAWLGSVDFILPPDSPTVIRDGCLIDTDSGTLLGTSPDFVLPQDGSIKTIASGAIYLYESDLQKRGGVLYIPDQVHTLERMWLSADRSRPLGIYLPHSIEHIEGPFYEPNVTIHYPGSCEEWKQIAKVGYYHWGNIDKADRYYTRIHCSDGIIYNDGTSTQWISD